MLVQSVAATAFRSDGHNLPRWVDPLKILEHEEYGLACIADK